MTAPGSQRGEIIMKKRIASAVLASEPYLIFFAMLIYLFP
jgi:hypothetical protein